MTPQPHHPLSHYEPIVKLICTCSSLSRPNAHTHTWLWSFKSHSVLVFCLGPATGFSTLKRMELGAFHLSKQHSSCDKFQPTSCHVIQNVSCNQIQQSMLRMPISILSNHPPNLNHLVVWAPKTNRSWTFYDDAIQVFCWHLLKSAMIWLSPILFVSNLCHLNFLAALMCLLLTSDSAGIWGCWYAIWISRIWLLNNVIHIYIYTLYSLICMTRVVVACWTAEI